MKEKEMKNEKLIKINDADQKFLVIGDDFSMDDLSDLDYEDFDCVLYLSIDRDKVFDLVYELNPISNVLFQFKPIFLNPVLSGDAARNQFADGYAFSINDPELISISKKILYQIVEYGFKKTFQTEYSERSLIIQVFRYMASRSLNLPTPVLKHASALGYARAILDLFYKKKLISIPEMLETVRNFKQKKYLEKISLIDRVHLCPQCLNSHLLFVEACPKCGSSNITEELMIHHFPCANVSPEATYYFEDKLKCPKCHRFLRHIGVDYDRPAVMYFCQDCGMDFIQPSIKVLCTKCRSQNKPENLVKYDVEEIVFTEAGVRALSSLSEMEVEKEIVKYHGLISFFSFVSLIRSRVEFYNYNHDLNNNVFVARIMLKNYKLQNSQEITSDCSTIICTEFNKEFVALFMNYFLILFIGESEKSIVQRSLIIKNKIEDNDSENNVKIVFDYLEYVYKSDVEQFIRNIQI
ncbi:MAG: hypothetical protein RR034_02490 [Bacteroidales bacterium]